MDIDCIVLKVYNTSDNKDSDLINKKCDNREGLLFSLTFGNKDSNLKYKNVSTLNDFFFLVSVTLDHIPRYSTLAPWLSKEYCTRWGPRK